MGKTASCIQMLQLLNSGRVYKCSELADLLDTNVRNIIEYKKELEEIGYYIISIPGRYGGYKLEKSTIVPSIRFTDKEKDILNEGTNYINTRNDFPFKNDFNYCMSKIFSSIRHETFDNDLLIINRYPLIMDEKEIKDRYQKLDDAIKFHNVVKLTYVSQKKTEREYLYHPYELFMFNNAWFVIGWNEKFGNISYFKLNRINNIEILDKKYTKWKYYNRNDYLDEFGFKNNGEWYHVEFIAKNNYAQLVKERLYGKNQVVEVIDSKQTLVKVDMQNKEDIKQFVLGFGEDIDVIEPSWLKDDLLNYAKFVIEKYK